MKRILSCGLAFVLILMACLSLAGCGTTKYDSMEAYLASDEMQSQIESQEEKLDGSGFRLKIVAQENKLIRIYTYDKMQDVDAAKQILKDGMDSQEEVYQNQANELKASVNIENPVLVVRYLNPDGTELYSREFAAE